MSPISKISVCFLSALITVAPTNAESLSKYADWMHNAQKEVWNADIQAFHNYTVPDSLKDESAVILAMYNSIESKKNEKINGSALAGLALGIAF